LFTILAASIALQFAAACTSQADMTIAADSSADLALTVEVHDIFAQYLKDLQETLGSGKELFNVQEIKDRVSAEPGLSVSAVSVTGNTLKLSVKVASLSKLAVQKDSFATVFNVKQGASGEQLFTVRLGPAAVKLFTGMLSKGDRSALDSLMPGAKTKDVKKYEEELSWALEDYATKAKLAEMFKLAKIRLKLVFPSNVISVVGGKQDAANPRAVSFEIGVLELMTLSTDRVFEVKY